ncbi:MAG: type II toxin-antitoxin system VapC family toxin [Blastocatellia bacterium]
MPSTESDRVLFDAGLFIGALLSGDPRYAEARPLVEAARRGELLACTTTGILSEVYAALTWHQAQPPHSPAQAAAATRLLIDSPSDIRILQTSQGVALRMMELVETHQLRARRAHDARHAAAALTAGVLQVYTYDVADWQVFEADGLNIAGPESTLRRLGRL